MAGLIIFVAAIVVCAIARAVIKQIRIIKTPVESVNNESTSPEMENSNNNAETPDTLGLMTDTLNALGCQPAKQDDGSLLVNYQGETFQMKFGGMYACVWDPVWADVRVDDPDLPKIREAVNIANFHFGPTVVLTAPDDEGVIRLHSRRDLMLHPACPDNIPFVKEVLDSFFEAKEHVRRYLWQLNTSQTETQAKRRPVGFSAAISGQDPENQ